MPPAKDNARLEAIEKRLDTIALDLAAVAHLAIATHGAKPSLLGVIERHDPGRLAVESKPASPTGRQVV